MRLTPDTRNFKFLKFFTSVGNFLQGTKKKSENTLKKIIFQTFFENFLSPSKGDLQNIVLAWTLKNFKIFNKKNLHRICFRAFQEEFFLALQKNSNTCKNFQNLKLCVSGVKRIFFGFLFSYPGQIPLMLMESACKKKITRLTR